MADKTVIANLKKEVERILAHKQEELITRSKWGEITFEDRRSDFERIYWFVSQLNAYPVEVLPDSILNSFVSALKTIADHLDQIDKFSVQSSNPTGTRDSLSNNLHQYTDSLYLQCASWIPFLAHQKGDIARNIANLTKSVKDADGIVTKAKADIEQKSEEIDSIIQTAREASAGAGAAVFTKDFENTANENDKHATKWLWITIGMAVATFAFAMYLWNNVEVIPVEYNVFIQKLTTKLFALALMLSATIWCGRNYKALKHLATINRHRSLSIKTLQAFSHAATDVQVKDAVLLEATRAVFGNVPTGFIPDGGSDGDLKIVEVARSILPKQDA